MNISWRRAEEQFQKFVEENRGANIEFPSPYQRVQRGEIRTKNQEERFFCGWFAPCQCGQGHEQGQGAGPTSTGGLSMLNSPRVGACLKHVCTLWNRERKEKMSRFRNYCLKLPTFYVILSFLSENHFKVQAGDAFCRARISKSSSVAAGFVWSNMHTFPLPFPCLFTFPFSSPG